MDLYTLRRYVYISVRILTINDPNREIGCGGKEMSKYKNPKHALSYYIYESQEIAI